MASRMMLGADSCGALMQQGMRCKVTRQLDGSAVTGEIFLRTQWETPLYQHTGTCRVGVGSRRRVSARARGESLVCKRNGR